MRKTKVSRYIYFHISLPMNLAKNKIEFYGFWGKFAYEMICEFGAKIDLHSFCFVIDVRQINHSLMQFVLS